MFCRGEEGLSCHRNQSKSVPGRSFAVGRRYALREQRSSIDSGVAVVSAQFALLEFCKQSCTARSFANRTAQHHTVSYRIASHRIALYFIVLYHRVVARVVQASKTPASKRCINATRVQRSVVTAQRLRASVKRDFRALKNHA